MEVPHWDPVAKPGKRSGGLVFLKLMIFCKLYYNGVVWK